jgi:hypothetical protein
MENDLNGNPSLTIEDEIEKLYRWDALYHGTGCTPN